MFPRSALFGPCDSLSILPVEVYGGRLNIGGSALCRVLTWSAVEEQYKHGPDSEEITVHDALKHCLAFVGEQFWAIYSGHAERRWIAWHPQGLLGRRAVLDDDLIPNNDADAHITIGADTFNFQITSYSAGGDTIPAGKKVIADYIGGTWYTGAFYKT